MDKPKNMKKTNTAIITIALMLIGTMAFAQSNERLILRIYEGRVNRMSKIIVTQNGKTLEERPLKAAERQSKNLERNQWVIDKTLNKYLDLGYEIESSVSGGNEAKLITTYILERE